MCISVMKSLSDLVNDSEDCYDEPTKAIFISARALKLMWSPQQKSTAFSQALYILLWKASIYDYPHFQAPHLYCM